MQKACCGKEGWKGFITQNQVIYGKKLAILIKE
jgi:hypothetical protein